MEKGKKGSLGRERGQRKNIDAGERRGGGEKQRRGKENVKNERSQ